MTNADEMVGLLRGLEFLSGFSEEDLGALARIAEVVEWPAGAVLFREGQKHPQIYLIVEGSVALEARVAPETTKRLQTVGRGELLGWSPLLDQREMTGTARALGPTRAVAIDGRQLGALCEHDPRLGYRVMRRTAQALARRLSATRLQLLDVYGHELPAFVAGGGVE
jgi:CRP-like cAMP-binding protein